MKKLLLPAFLLIAISGFSQVTSVHGKSGPINPDLQAYSKLYVQALQGSQKAHAQYRVDSANVERCVSKSNLFDSARYYHGRVYQDRSTEKNFLSTAAFLKSKIDSINAKKR